MTGSVSQRRVALVVGAGGGNGAAIARRFAREDYVACVNRRNAQALQALVQDIEGAGGRAVACPGDMRLESVVSALVEQVEREQGPIEVAVFNPAIHWKKALLDETAAGYQTLWESAALAGFLVAREVARRMLPRGRGCILFTGATASLRGGAGFAAFAGAKHAVRALAQSMARELGPQGIHVAHVVVDGLIDTPARRAAQPDGYARLSAEGKLISPQHVADAFWYLSQQPRDAWTFELDLRPDVEHW